MLHSHYAASEETRSEWRETMICLRSPSFGLVRGTTNVGTCYSAH